MSDPKEVETSASDSSFFLPLPQETGPLSPGPSTTINDAPPRAPEPAQAVAPFPPPPQETGPHISGPEATIDDNRAVTHTSLSNITTYAPPQETSIFSPGPSTTINDAPPIAQPSAQAVAIAPPPPFASQTTPASYVSTVLTAIPLPLAPAPVPTFFSETQSSPFTPITHEHPTIPAVIPPAPSLIPAIAPAIIPALSINNDGDAIEADDQAALETDSAFGEDAHSNVSSRTSLISGIAKYRIENGRRYHAYRDGKYLLPNDETEQDRLDLHHHIFNLVSGGKLFHAPIDKPSRVLDAGTGTGIWAIDFADQFPESHVIGSDLSPIQPGWIPPNLEFEIDDIEDPWRHKPFNYIHMRSLSGAIKSWSTLLSQAYAHLAPGGWLEIIEFEVWVHDQRDEEVIPPLTAYPPPPPHHYQPHLSGSLGKVFSGGDKGKGKEEEGEGMGEWREKKERDVEMVMIRKWQEGLSEAGRKIGRRFDVAVNLRDWFIEAGFVGVVERVTRVPGSPWPRSRRQKEIGLYQQQNMLDASSSYGQAHFTRVLGWSPEEYEVLSAGVRSELKDLRFQQYSNLFVVYGQKPYATTAGDDGGGH